MDDDDIKVGLTPFGALLSSGAWDDQAPDPLAALDDVPGVDEALAWLRDIPSDDDRC